MPQLVLKLANGGASPRTTLEGIAVGQVQPQPVPHLGPPSGSQKEICRWLLSMLCLEAS